MNSNKKATEERFEEVDMKIASISTRGETMSSFLGYLKRIMKIFMMYFKRLVKLQVFLFPKGTLMLLIASQLGRRLDLNKLWLSLSVAE